MGFKLRSMPTRLLCAAAAVTIAGCSSATDDGGTVADLRGSWIYSATQAGAATLLEGSFIIDEQDGSTFSGQFNGHVRDAQGVISNLDGVASGRAFGDAAIDFDLIANGVERRHVGRIARTDSVGGTWAQQNGAASASGSFTLKRP